MLEARNLEIFERQLDNLLEYETNRRKNLNLTLYVNPSPVVDMPTGCKYCELKQEQIDYYF